jgi:hypothetical protein
MLMKTTGIFASPKLREFCLNNALLPVFVFRRKVADSFHSSLFSK